MLGNLAVAPSFGFNKPVRQFGIQHRIHFKPTAKPFERAKSQCPPTASGHAQTGVDNSLKKNGFANTFRALAVVIAGLLSRYRQGVVHAQSVTPITTAAIQDWIQNLAAIVLNVRHDTV